MRHVKQQHDLRNKNSQIFEPFTFSLLQLRALYTHLKNSHNNIRHYEVYVQSGFSPLDVISGENED